MCDKASGNSKGSKIYCAKKFSGSSKDCQIQSLLCDKASGNSKGSKIYCAKKFSGSSKDCQIQSLLCDKVFGNSKGSKIYCAKKIKVARFTVPKNFLGDWKVNVSKPVPIHGEHQSPAQWPHTRIFPGKQNL